MTTQLSPTARFEKLLLSTDGSEFSAGATRLAFELAKLSQAKLHVMTVVITNPEYEALAPKLLEKSEREAREVLVSIKKDAEAAGIECETQILHGEDPATETLSLAEQISSDVILMGRRGKRMLARWMVGHVTIQVISRAHCPVLVVPRVATIPTHRILVATDGSRYSDNAAANAAKLAKLCKLPITVLSVVSASHNEKRRAEAQAVVERVCELLNKDGITSDGSVAEGVPAELIISTAQQRGADLIVVGSHGRTGLERVLVGSVSERVIGLSQYATLVVKA